MPRQPSGPDGRHPTEGIDLVEVLERLRASGSVFADEEARLLVEASAGDEARLAHLLDRRVTGTPLEVLVGWVDFAGRRVQVGPRVFVPRRRTELLVTTAVRLLSALPPPADGAVQVVELCCGVAAVSCALLDRVPDLRVHAVDIDPAAVPWARRNLAGRGSAAVGDLTDPLPPSLVGSVDLMLANAPYVPRAELVLLPSEARDHEPTVALDGGSDGLDVQRRIAALAPAWLRPGGFLAVETSPRLADGSADVLGGQGFDVELVAGEGEAVVAVGRRRPSAR